MNIKEKVNSIIKKYNTNIPSQLVESLGYVLLYRELDHGDYGYSLTSNRINIIVMNDELPSEFKEYVLAHEIGHMVLHKDINCQFLSKHTLFSIDKIERQADTFAVELLLPDTLLKEYSEYGAYTLANMVGIPAELVPLKFN